MVLVVRPYIKLNGISCFNYINYRNCTNDEKHRIYGCISQFSSFAFLHFSHVLLKNKYSNREPQ